MNIVDIWLKEGPIDWLRVLEAREDATSGNRALYLTTIDLGERRFREDFWDPFNNDIYKIYGQAIKLGSSKSMGLGIVGADLRFIKTREFRALSSKLGFVFIGACYA